LDQLIETCANEAGKTNPLKTPICKALKEFNKEFYRGILLDHRTRSQTSIQQGITQAVEKLEHSLLDSFERRYFTEAKGCAEHGFCRSFIVVAWSIAMYRLYCLIQKSGFVSFEQTYLTMFPKSNFSLTSLEDFFDVSDHNVLQVAASKSIIPHIIDKHQRETLLRNLRLRNMCAHVSKNYAPTEPTLIGFVDEVVDSFLSVAHP